MIDQGTAGLVSEMLTNQDDTVDYSSFSDSGNDGVEVYAMDGDDTIEGSKQADVLHGQAGDDTLTDNNGTGGDTLDGGVGDDYLFESGNGGTLLGGDGNDTLAYLGSYGYLVGGSGIDTFILFASSTNNVLVAGDDGSYLDGHKTTGSNIYFGGAGADTILGGSGNDTIYGNGGDDVIKAGNGNDYIDAGTGATTVTAGNGNNYISTAGPGTSITVGDGYNTLVLSGGGATVHTENGNNVVYAYTTDLPNLVYTGDGADIINGTGATATQGYSTGGGNDFIFTGHGYDYVYPGDGNDYVVIGSGGALVDAGYGDDIVFGGTGIDNIQGSYGDDRLGGGIGDTLFGGEGKDILTFLTNSGTVGTVHMMDYDVREDTIDLTNLSSNVKLSNVHDDGTSIHVLDPADGIDITFENATFGGGDLNVTLAYWNGKLVLPAAPATVDTAPAHEDSSAPDTQHAFHGYGSPLHTGDLF